MMYVTIPIGTSLTSISYGPGSLGTLVGNVVGFAIVVGAVLTLLWLILGGIEWITAGGDKSKVEQARDRITQALVGFTIVMASWAIWSLVTRNFFGLDLTSGISGDSGTNTTTTPTRDCSANCTYGTQLCYRECIPERPTRSRAVGCPNGSWVTSDEQADPACPPR